MTAFALGDFHRALFAFERNTFVRASAGTGKTEALTGLYLHLVTGAAAGPPLSPARIVAITFTEKATEEMRERIGRALRVLATRGGTHDDAADTFSVRAVCASLRARGRPLPEQLPAAAEQLTAAPIHTFHGFAAKLLRAHGDAIGFDPGVNVVDEARAAGWMEEALVAAIEAELRTPGTAVRGVVEELGNLTRLVGNLAGIVASLREMGRAPADVFAEGPLHPKAAAARVAVARTALGLGATDGVAGAWERLVSAHTLIPDDVPPRQRSGYDAVAEAALALRDRPGFGTDDLDALMVALVHFEERDIGTKAAGSEPTRLAVRTAIRDLWAAPRASARLEALVRVMQGALERYAERKRIAYTIDFADQLLSARRLLLEVPAVRDEVVRGIGALLVDEFQDTNVIQRDLVHLLRARPGLGAAVPSAEGMLPSGLLVVGDPKQSIYGFRNADVAVFQSMADDLARTGGTTLFLRPSYRSHRGILPAMNAVTAHALGGADAQGLSVGFRPEEDALEPVQSARLDPPSPGPFVTLLEAPAKKKGLPEPVSEADLLARHLARTLRGDGAPLVRDRRTGAVRPATFGDVAILLRRFSHVADYTRALLHEGVPHVVVKGRGLFEAQEVKDTLALLRVLAGEADDVSMLALLRSPMVLLDDPSLQRLAGCLPGRGSRRGWAALAHGVPADLDVTDAGGEHLVALLGELARLVAAADRVGLAEAARAFHRITDYPAVLAMLPNGAQRVRNIASLLDELAARERVGETGSAVLHEVLRRSNSDREAERDAESAEDAVRIMTVHQAKGLEFPVVVAAELHGRLANHTALVEFDRAPGAGLAVVAGRVGGSRQKDSHHAHVVAVAKARDEAERARNFYVQVTRARDHLLLSGKPAELMKRMLDTKEGPLADLPRLDVAVLSDASEAVAPKMRPASPELDLTDLSRRVNRLPAPADVVHASVTELEDHHLCPRRHRARHLLRLAEDPVPRRGPGETPQDRTAPDPRRRGTDTHALLEEMDFVLLARDPAHAVVAAAARAHVLLTPEIDARLRALGRTAYAASLAAEDAARIAREVPFTLEVVGNAVEDAGARGRVLLRGQVDLLVTHSEGIDVIDYKVTSRAGVEAARDYAFQLAAYARAVRAAYPGKAVRVGVWFVGGAPTEPVFLPATEAGASDDAVGDAAASLLTAVRTGEAAGRERAVCDAIACGYRWVCHGLSESHAS